MAEFLCNHLYALSDARKRTRESWHSRRSILVMFSQNWSRSHHIRKICHWLSADQTHRRFAATQAITWTALTDISPNITKTLLPDCSTYKIKKEIKMYIYNSSTNHWKNEASLRWSLVPTIQSSIHYNWKRNQRNTHTHTLKKFLFNRPIFPQ